MSEGEQKKYSRREILGLLAVGGATYVLTACGLGTDGEATLEVTAVAPNKTGTPPPTSHPTTAVLTSSTPAAATTQPVTETGPWQPPSISRITPNDSFYTMKYNPSPPPEVNEADYRLVIEGEVDHPLSLSLAELKAFPVQEEMRTLQCISNPVGGNLIGNATWKGVSMALLLQEAGIRSAGRYLRLESLDGYHTGIPRALALDEHSFLAYEMNGETLPAKHGYPIRCLWPGRYGQKQPKWLNQITVQRQPHTGHWEGAGWSDEAIIQPTSIIEHPISRQQLPADFYVGGVAFTVREGLHRVEVSLDDGTTWREAELLPAPSSLAWTHWWIEVSDLEPAAYRILARAVDNLGQAQRSSGRNTSLLDDTFPNGTIEMHRVVAQVRRET